MMILKKVNDAWREIKPNLCDIPVTRVSRDLKTTFSPNFAPSNALLTEIVLDNQI